MDVAPVYQTVSYTTNNKYNTSDSDSLNMTADENDPDMNDFCQRVVSSDDENTWIRTTAPLRIWKVQGRKVHIVLFQTMGPRRT